MKSENMMEWKLKMWRNEIVKYDGIIKTNFIENGVVYFSVIQDIKKEGLTPLITPSSQISYWIYFL